MSRVTLDVFQLQSQLRAYRAFASAQTTLILKAMDNADGAPVAPLAMEAFEQTSAALEALQLLPELKENETLSESAIARMARMIAVAVNAHVAARYQAARVTPSNGPVARIQRTVARAEKAYASALLDTRAGAKSGRIERLGAALTTCMNLAQRELPYVAGELGGQDDEVKASRAVAVRLAEVTRRIAMLSGAALQLMFRMTNPRKVAGLRQAAENRPVLARHSHLLTTAMPRAVAPAEGDVLALHVKSGAVTYVEEGDGHSSVALEAGDVSELRLPRRNLLRLGVSQGSRVIAKGTAREVDGARFVEIERDAISTHAATVWEDYLVTEMRDLYDFKPQSLQMAWEFPDMRELGARNELRGRV